MQEQTWKAGPNGDGTRDMTLAECVGSLPAGHSAREEWELLGQRAHEGEPAQVALKAIYQELNDHSFEGAVAQIRMLKADQELLKKRIESLNLSLATVQMDERLKAEWSANDEPVDPHAKALEDCKALGFKITPEQERFTRHYLGGASVLKEVDTPANWWDRVAELRSGFKEEILALRNTDAAAAETARLNKVWNGIPKMQGPNDLPEPDLNPMPEPKSGLLCVLCVDDMTSYSRAHKEPAPCDKCGSVIPTEELAWPVKGKS